MNKHLLLILDGYGIAEDPSVSAIDAAKKPFLDALFAAHPHGTLQASERAVGLPVGQMGNSEVGHMNLGAGRVVYQDLVRIDAAIEDGTFFANPVLVGAVRHAKARGTKLHLFGLFSDGGVHSHLAHLFALLRLAAQEGLGTDQVFVHAFTDGRDTDPHAAGDVYVQAFEAAAQAARRRADRAPSWGATTRWTATTAGSAPSAPTASSPRARAPSAASAQAPSRRAMRRA